MFGTKHRRNSGRARDAWSSVLIVAGRIIDLDPTKWTCTVATEIGLKTLRNVDVGSAYLHPFDGEGVHVMPEIGAPVWAARSSEGDTPWFIIRFRGYPLRTINEGSNQNLPNFRTNRPRMGPGDIVLTTRDRNGLKLRRGGVTEISGAPLCKTIYTGQTGTIHSIAKNVQMDSFGGSLLWKVEREEKDADGHKATVMALRLKEFADNQAHVVQLDVGGGDQLKVPAKGDSDGGDGSHGPAPHSAELVNAPVLRLRVFQKGDVEEEDLEEVISLGLDKDGQAEFALTGQLNIEIRGDKNVTLKMTPSGDVELETEGKVEITSTGDQTLTSSSGNQTIEASDGEQALTASSKQTLTAGALSVTNDGSTVSVGNGLNGVIMDAQFSTMLSNALTELVASITAVGAGIPAGLSVAVVTPNTVALTGALGSTTFTSTTLKTD